MTDHVLFMSAVLTRQVEGVGGYTVMSKLWVWAEVWSELIIVPTLFFCHPPPCLFFEFNNKVDGLLAPFEWLGAGLKGDLFFIREAPMMISVCEVDELLASFCWLIY